MGARVLIVGAGPAGLATAAALAARGVDARLVDRNGVAGGAYARMDPAIVMTTPSALVSLPGLAAPRDQPYLTAAAYGAYLERYAEHHRLRVERADVTSLERASRSSIEARLPRPVRPERVDRNTQRSVRPERVDRNTQRSVRPERRASASEPGVEARRAGGYVASIDGDGDGDETYDAIVLATGMFDFPVRPAIAGLPADGAASATRPRVVHAAQWRVADARAGERVLVVGGASSAVEIAEACARAGSIVSVSVRDRVAIQPATIAGIDPTRALMPLLARLPPALARGFCAGRRAVPAADRGFGALRRAGRIAVVAAVARLDGRTAILAGGRRLDVDVVILATGYRHAVTPAPAGLARDERGVPRTRAGESVSHRGLFVVGAPCVRRAASQYLYGMARDAPAIAAAIASRLSSLRDRAVAHRTV